MKKSNSCHAHDTFFPPIPTQQQAQFLSVWGDSQNVSALANSVLRLRFLDYRELCKWRTGCVWEQKSSAQAKPIKWRMGPGIHCPPRNI
ncbi:hypothetical protein V6N13_020645 [Hibiscus sabdariffa]|uniref:Uncharacterized protein n=1 Tax=Hibiscus sabdariffa TaxID=183260 RepID=A0ABR2EW19_9ROSI